MLRLEGKASDLNAGEGGARSSSILIRLKARRRFHQVSLSGRIQISFYTIKEKPFEIELISPEGGGRGGGGGGGRIYSTPDGGLSVSYVRPGKEATALTLAEAVSCPPAGRRIGVPASPRPATLAVAN